MIAKTNARRMLRAFTNQLMVLLTICVGASATVFAHRTFIPEDPPDASASAALQPAPEPASGAQNPRRRVDSEGDIPDNAQPSNRTHQ